MDLFIIISSIVEFSLFFVLHLVVFRRVNQLMVLKWLSLTFLLVGFGAAIIELFIINVMTGAQIQFSQVWGIIGITFILYSFMVFVYIVGIFGVVESAIRIKLLDFIAKAEAKGVKRKEISKTYSKEKLIKKRLQRFVNSKELICRQGWYRINRRWSLIYIPAIIIKIMWWLYGIDKQDNL